MTEILVWRDKLRLIYRDYEKLLRPLWKFLLSIIIIFYINQVLGYDHHLKNGLIIFAASLVAAFVPAQFFVIITAGFALIHVYAAASLLALLVIGVFLVLFLLFERFTPGYSYVLVLMPLAMSLQVPLLLALLIGLLAEPAGIIAAGCGIIVFFLFQILKTVVFTTAGEITLESMIVSYQNVMDMLIHNRAMFLYLAAIAFVIIVVYLIRIQPIAHAFQTAILVGSLLFLTVLLIGELIFKIDGSPVFLLIGSVVSVLLAFMIQFLLYPLDYSRIETIQFDDDDYYYYVKAVPKMQVAAPRKQVKRINVQHVTGNTTNLQEVQQKVSNQEKMTEDSFEAEPSEIFDRKLGKYRTKNEKKTIK